MIDPEYLERLDQIASAPDDMFPELLFKPLSNDYEGDLYFELDFEDFDNEAVRVDPRFTKQRISQIRGTAKRIDKYLEWVDLYDCYVEYLTNKYGSMDIVQDMIDNGIFREPRLNVSHRPMLRKGKSRRLLKNGLIPSFMGYGIDENEVYEFIKRLCDEDQPDVTGEEEPDIQWALDREPTKQEKRIFETNIEKYRQAQRSQMLASGAAARGIGTGFDFVNHYYAEMERGEYDTVFSDDSTKSKSGIAGMMAQALDREFMHEGQLLGLEADKKDKYTYNGGPTIRHEKDDTLAVFYKYLQEQTGIDIMGALSGSMNKKAFKAVRADFVQAGGQVVMSEKEAKKLRKKRKKLEREQDRVVRAGGTLAEVLTNNRILMNGGTVRFEDMLRGGFDD